ncbi:MAG: hypothetical protein AUH86_18655 [Acidobacteria bacterium 13_1_40CM_4_58_4]|nr:MAG: hypothetical protein AUH86_18655 [Acidobacteria bacterium 13_1_40CM_4_58_4]
MNVKTNGLQIGQFITDWKQRARFARKCRYFCTAGLVTRDSGLIGGEWKPGPSPYFWKMLSGQVQGVGVGENIDTMELRGEGWGNRDSTQEKNGGRARDSFDKHTEL